MKRLHFVCKLNREIYKVVTEDIACDEVIITDKQIEHIKERHPDDYELFAKYAALAVTEPDYIMAANKPNTAVVLKEVILGEQHVKLILRIKTSADPAEYKNSIITFQHVSSKRYERYVKNAQILYNGSEVENFVASTRRRY